MGRIEFDAYDNLDIRVERSDDKTGTIVISITCDNDDKITINAGRFQDNAYQLHDELAYATKQALDIRDNWQDKAKQEDGYVFDDRSGYYAKLSGSQEGPFSSQDIATYELARMMSEGGFFPNTWYEGERGIDRMINAEVYAYLDDEDKIKPLEGVRYEEGASVRLAGDDWPHWVVDRDYGNLGVMVYTSGDPSVNMLATHDQLQPYDEDDEEEEYDHSRAKEDARNAYLSEKE